MNSSDHAQLRYIERIIGIKGREAKHYLGRNREVVSRHIEKMFSHATFLWEGKLASPKTRRFYLRDDIILITDQHENCVITLYRADYGFSQSTNRQFVKELLELIEHKRDVQAKTDDEFKLQRLEYEIKDCCIKIINSIEYRMELEQVS